jgi:hypothetical protein
MSQNDGIAIHAPHEQRALTGKPPRFAPFHFDPAAQVEEVEMIYDRLLKKRDIVVWLAREKSGKSTLLLQLAMCAAAGKAFLHFRFLGPHPLRVVIIDYESTDSVLQKRYQSILNDLCFSEQEQELVKQNLKILLVRKIRAAGEKFPPLPIPGSTHITSASQQSDKFWKQFPEDYPADIYCIDPLRSAHVGDENDSKIFGLMESLQTIFHGKNVIVPHHLKKRGSQEPKDVRAITRDMRDWSDRGRGSAAIKAHADVIICQAREVDSASDEDAVYWGAFGRDMEDINPMKLVAVGPESFAFKVEGGLLPDGLAEHWDIVVEHLHGQRTFTQAQFVSALTKAEVSRATAYRRFNTFQNRGLIVATATEGTFGFARTVRLEQQNNNNE